MMNLKDKVVVITGAGRGIGQAVACLFAGQGAKLVLASRTMSELKMLASDIERGGGKTLPVVCDMAKEDQIERLVAEALKAFGKIDILVNNAGVIRRGKVADAKIEEWDMMLDINLRGAMICAKKVLPTMLKAKQGVIINISSISGLNGYGGSSGYCASKFGLVGFSEALFEEVRERGIKVSVICPGYVDTPLISDVLKTRQVNRKKMIRPQDIAQACLYVATSSPDVCPTEIVMMPQKEPEA